MRLGVLLILALLVGCSGPAEPAVSNSAHTPSLPNSPRFAELHAAMPKIAPFFRPMGKPRAGDWLAAFHEEGQTFDEWLQADPTLPTADRKKLYVLPLGHFSDVQLRVIAVTAGYLSAFYGLPVETLNAQPLKVEFPNVRHSDYTNTRQVKTDFILEKVLASMLQKDAAALIAFTDQDLYPDDSMGYVFGQASFEKRVGVWSLYRLRDASFERFLRRTIKIAAHETGHMFSMHHCILYECLMSGTNQLNETDRRPIDACPECTAKICWLSDQKPTDRYRRLAEFCRNNGLEADARDFERKASALGK